MKPTTIITALIVGLIMFACTSTKTVYVPVESQSENVQYIEREVVRHSIDTVPVYIELPAQSAMVVTPDTVSHLETDYAESFARWSGGMLTHTLNNKTAPIPQQVEVPRVETEKHTERTDTITISVPYEVPVTVYVDKPPNKWTQFKIDAFWWLIGGLAGVLAFLFRSPIISLIRKFIF